MTGHRILIAATDGDCARCPEPIRAGDRIALMPDDSYWHARHLPRTIVPDDYTRRMVAP